MRAHVTAPAKVNLSLLVGPRRADGYHEVFTVLAPIDLVDQLDFELSARPPGARGGGARAARPGDAGREAVGGELRINCYEAPGESNLVARALRSLERETGWVIEGVVSIEKGIPMGAGLGGGSSDAAAALKAGARALAESGGQPLSHADLGRIARELGADVPFFLDPRCSIARGMGDVLEQLSLPALDIVVVSLPEGLATARVYQALDTLGADEDRNSFQSRAAEAEDAWKALAEDWTTGKVSQEAALARVAALLRNDLEKASFSLLPLIEETKRVLLAEEPPGVLMSGSGSTLFAVCRSAEEAGILAGRLGEQGLSARSARACSPPELS